MFPIREVESAGAFVHREQSFLRQLLYKFKGSFRTECDTILEVRWELKHGLGMSFLVGSKIIVDTIFGGLPEGRIVGHIQPVFHTKI